MGKIKIQNDKFNQGMIILNFAVTDVSGSMLEGEKEVAVRNALKIIKGSLMGMEDTSSTRVSVIEFGSEIRYSDLKTVESFSTDYKARNEGTKLYDSIRFLKNEVLELYEEYCIKRGYSVTINIFYLSDGVDYGSITSESSAIEDVKELREKVAPGFIMYDIGYQVADVARRLGVQVKSCDATKESIEEQSRDLSQMLVESSQSGVPIGMELSQSQISESAIASEQFKEAMSSAKTLDMFDLLMDI